MEKNPFGKNIGKNIKKVAGIAGLSVLSMLPNDKSQEPSKKADDIFLNPKNKIENKIEWERSELKPGKIEEIASDLIRTSFKKEDYIEEILRIETNIKELTTEIHFRKLNNDSKKNLTFLSNEELLSCIKNFEEMKKEYEEKLNYLEHSYEHNAEMPISLKENVRYEFERIKKIIYYYDIGRQWVLDNLQNSEYKDRFEKEEEESFSDWSMGDLKEYIKEVGSFKIKQASDNNFIVSKDIKRSYGDDSANVAAFYSHENNKIYFPLDNDSLSAIDYAIHEYAHKITKGNNFISKKVLKLFTDSFDSLSVIANLSDEKEKKSEDFLESITYFSNPTEMYARKKVFDYDLERLGVKKYEEKFTIKHYLKALQLRKEGKLNSDSNEFLYSIKRDMIIKVMNEIADIDYKQKQTKNAV